MSFQFNWGEFVWGKDEINYEEVLNDFKNAKKIRILTYNISKKSYSNILIDKLKEVSADVDVKIITNIPSRYKNYYSGYSGNKAKKKYRQNFTSYLDKLNPENFQSNPYVAFNFTNHAKIIGTDNIIYIGSANYSDESKNNIESGTLIRDKEFIEKVYNEVFPKIIDESTPYFENTFNVLRLFISSMENKFSAWLYKFDEDVVWKNTKTKIRGIRENLALDLEDLYEIEADLDELNDFEILLDDTYNEDDDEYNDFIEQIKKEFNKISLGWMENFVAVDSDFYDFINYDVSDKACEYLQEYPDAYDENLDYYTNISMDRANDEYTEIRSNIEEDLLFFRDEIKRIVDLLSSMHEKIMAFSFNWIEDKIDNT